MCCAQIKLQTVRLCAVHRSNCRLLGCVLCTDQTADCHIVCCAQIKLQTVILCAVHRLNHWKITVIFLPSLKMLHVIRFHRSAVFIKIDWKNATEHTYTGHTSTEHTYTEHTYNLPDSENVPSGQKFQHNPGIHQHSFRGVRDYLYFLSCFAERSYTNWCLGIPNYKLRRLCAVSLQRTWLRIHFHVERYSYHRMCFLRSYG